MKNRGNNVRKFNCDIHYRDARRLLPTEPMAFKKSQFLASTDSFTNFETFGFYYSPEKN